MKFIRHLLSHMMFIILVAGIVAVYYFRNQILPAEYVQKVDLYAGKVHSELVAIASPLKVNQQQAAVENKYQESERVAVVDTVPEPEAQAEVAEEQEVFIIESEAAVPAPVNEEPKVTVAVTVAESNEAEKTVTINEPENAQTDKNTLVAEAKTVIEEVAASEVPKAGKQPEAENVAEAEKNIIVATAEAATENKPVSLDKEAASYKEILHAARTAYANSKFKVAVEKYKELIALEDHEADFYGELGNVYYAMGNWDKAGETYYEAAQRLIESGKVSQVYYLQRVLQGLNKDLATKLSQQMQVNQKNIIAR